MRVLRQNLVQNLFRNLCSNEVVVVTVHYRLGFLGLLFLDDETTPEPNLCMWDLKMALEWVRDNVNKFNGDRENVTIMGHSSGSALAEFLCLSPMTKGKSFFSMRQLFE